MIQEPWPFVRETSRKWYSHKFKGPGLRYEIGVSIRTGDIVWFHGPFPAGTPDITIFRMKLKQRLGIREKVITDFGYRGEPSKISLPDDGLVSHDDRVAASKARARHEALNGKLKRFSSLKQVFRHNRDKHQYFFRAAITVLQLLLNHGELTFDIPDYHATGFL